MTDGNFPAAKDELAREESVCEISCTHDLMIRFGMISRGDVLFAMEQMILYTSSGVVGVKTDRVVEGTEPIGCNRKLIDAHDCSADEILNRKLANLSLKNRLKLLASHSESLLHKSPPTFFQVGARITEIQLVSAPTEECKESSLLQYY